MLLSDASGNLCHWQLNHLDCLYKHVTNQGKEGKKQLIQLFSHSLRSTMQSSWQTLWLNKYPGLASGDKEERVSFVYCSNNYSYNFLKGPQLMSVLPAPLQSDWKLIYDQDDQDSWKVIAALQIYSFSCCCCQMWPSLKIQGCDLQF